MSEFSEEQQQFIHSQERCNLVQALAGSGKSHAIIERILQYPQKKFLILAFNVSAAKTMRKKIDDLCKENFAEVSTIHSFAFTWLVKREPTLSSRIYAGNDISREFQKHFPHIVFSKNPEYNADIWFSITGLFRKFCQSEYDFVDDYLDDCTSQIREYRILHNLNCPRERIYETLRLLENAFASKIPVEHDMYLKLAARELRTPLPYDEIILDEAQDANACTISMMMRQRHITKSFVGDPGQRIYAWRGCADAFQTLQGKGKTFHFTKSFRCPDSVASFVRPWLSFFHTADFTGTQDTRDVQTHVRLARTRIGYMHMLLEYEHMGVPAESIMPFGGMPDFQDIFTFIRQAEHDETFLEHERARAERLELTEIKGLCDILQATSGKAQKIREQLYEFMDFLTEEQQKKYGTEEEPSRYVSTGHKAKGAEFDQVFLEDDFLHKSTLFGEHDIEEIRLLYVALTRARVFLSPDTRELYALSRADLREICYRLRTKKLVFTDQGQNVSERVLRHLEMQEAQDAAVA